MDVEIRVLHNKIFEIVLYFDGFCREHQITYYLMGGSALGAIRHNGFIPWDDDFDVFMTRQNYIKFIDACETSIDKERFYLQRENTDEWPLFFSKLRMNNTTFLESDTKDRMMHKGIYIDIFCLYNVSANAMFRSCQYFASRLIVAKTLAKRGYNTTSKFKKLAMFMTKHLLKGPLYMLALSVAFTCKKKNTGYVGNIFGDAGFRRFFFPTRFLGEPRYVQFETRKLPVPDKAECYLSLVYGSNFMEIPDQKTRDKYATHATFVDTENCYKRYEKSDCI